MTTIHQIARNHRLHAAAWCVAVFLGAILRIFKGVRLQVTGSVTEIRKRIQRCNRVTEKSQNTPTRPHTRTRRRVMRLRGYTVTRARVFIYILLKYIYKYPDTACNRSCNQTKLPSVAVTARFRRFGRKSASPVPRPAGAAVTP